MTQIDIPAEIVSALELSAVTLKQAQSRIAELEVELTEAKARAESYRMALDPDCTKALYMGEFKSDTRKGEYISWTLTKKIMHHISMTADAMLPVVQSREGGEQK